MWKTNWNETSEKLGPNFVTTLGCTLPVCLDFVRSLVQWFLGPPALSQKFHFLFFWLLLGFTSLTRFKRKDQDHRLNSMGQARVNVDFEPRFVSIFWQYSVTFYCLKNFNWNLNAYILLFEYFLSEKFKITTDYSSTGQARVNVNFKPRFHSIFWHYSITFYVSKI